MNDIQGSNSTVDHDKFPRQMTYIIKIEFNPANVIITVDELDLHRSGFWQNAQSHYIDYKAELVLIKWNFKIFANRDGKSRLIRLNCANQLH